MGILGLSKLIADIAPEAIKERELKHYFGTFYMCFICVELKIQWDLIRTHEIKSYENDYHTCNCAYNLM